MPYSPSEPHPDFGTDPNIINTSGHTKYPKRIVAPDGTPHRVLNEEEEKKIMGTKPEGWGKK